MNSPLPFRLVAIAFLAFVTLIVTAHAGELIGREEFLGAISDPSIRGYVAEHFELAEEGRSLRAGRLLANSGERIAPFEIAARSRDDSEGGVVLHLDSSATNQVLVIPCGASVHYDSNCQ